MSLKDLWHGNTPTLTLDLHNMPAPSKKAMAKRDRRVAACVEKMGSKHLLAVPVERIPEVKLRRIK